MDNAEHLDLVMPMHNFLQYISNYFEKTGSLWFYFKDEAANFNDDIANNDNFKSFRYKTNSKRPSKIACMVKTVHITFTQTGLHLIENFCMVLIPLCKNNLNLSISHTDHYYALRK